MQLPRIRHNWVTNTHTHTHTNIRTLTASIVGAQCSLPIPGGSCLTGPGGKHMPVSEPQPPSPSLLPLSHPSWETSLEPISHGCPTLFQVAAWCWGPARYQAASVNVPSYSRPCHWKPQGLKPSLLARKLPASLYHQHREQCLALALDPQSLMHCMCTHVASPSLWATRGEGMKNIQRKPNRSGVPAGHRLGSEAVRGPPAPTAPVCPAWPTNRPGLRKPGTPELTGLSSGHMWLNQFN